MKRVTLVLQAALLAFILAAGVAGCGAKNSEYTGVYVSEKDRSDYIELTDAGAFTFVRDVEETRGSYEVLEGGVLDLSAESYRSTMKIDNGVITAIDATRFVRGPGEQQ